MSASQLNYIMQKLYEKEKILIGGKKDAQGQSKIEDKFKDIRNIVQEGLHYIRKKQQDKEEKMKKSGPSVDTVRLSGEIKDKIAEVQKQIGQMNDELRKQQKDKKKYSATELEVKEKMYTNCMEQLRALQSIEKGGTQAHEKVKTMTELRSDLLGGDGSAEQQERQRQADKELTADEEAALDQFKKKDQELDAVIDQINTGLGDLKDKALVMGQQIDQQGLLIKNLDQEVDKTNEQLVTANAKLKKILTQYREPSKFCMDIVLICILLGLGGVLYNMFSSS